MACPRCGHGGPFKAGHCPVCGSMAEAAVATTVVPFDTTGLPEGATFGPTLGPSAGATIGTAIGPTMAPTPHGLGTVGSLTVGGADTGTGTGTGELGAMAARRSGPLKVGQ